MRKTSIHLLGLQEQVEYNNSHSICLLPLHHFTIPPMLLLLYKQAAVDFQFNVSGHELQRLQSKHYPFSCLCHGDSNLLQRGKLNKWKK